MEGGLFQAFYMLFKTNASEAVKELGTVEDAADKTEKAASEATEKLEGVGKAATKSASNASSGIKKLTSDMASADRAAGKLKASFFEFAKGLAAPLLASASLGSLVSIARDRAEAIDAISKGAKKADLPVGDFEAFSRAARDMGGSIQGAEADLATFYQKVGEARIDPKADISKQFTALKVSLKGAKGEARSTKDVLLSLADSVSKLDATKATARLRKLGLTDQGTIDTLLKGRKAVEEMIDAQKRNGVVTEEQARIVKDYRLEMDHFKDMMQGLGNVIAEYVLPTLTSLSRGFRAAFQWLSDHKGLVEGFFVGLAGVLTAVYLPAVIKATIATVALLAPYLAIAAVVLAVGAAFALAWEDVKAFLNGQPSLLGDLAKKYEWVATTIEKMGQAYKVVSSVASWFSDEAASAFDSVMTSNKEATEDVKKAWAVVQPVLAGVLNEVKRDARTLGHALAPLAESIGEDLGRAGSTLKGWWDATVTFIQKKWGEVKASFSEAWPAIKDELATIWQGVQDWTQIIGDALVSGFKAGVDAVMKLWHGLVSAIESGWGVITGIFSSSKDKAETAPYEPQPQANPGPLVLNPDGTYNPPAGMSAARAATQGMLATAPFGAQTGAQVAGGQRGPTEIKKTVKVDVGGVNIQTAATDAQGIAASIGQHVEGSMRQTASAFDDGVER